MWLSKQSRGKENRESPADVGTVTLEGERTAVYLAGERRDLPALAPGGYHWRPMEGESVQVLKAGADGEQSWVLGTRTQKAIQPGEVFIQGPSASST